MRLRTLIRPCRLNRLWGGIGPGGVWLPSSASIPLRAWYRPDLGLTQAGGLVSAWADQSGAGDANRNQGAAGALRPGYVASDAAYGNRPVVTGSGTQYLAAGGAWSAAIVAPITVVIIGNSGGTNETYLSGNAGVPYDAMLAYDASASGAGFFSSVLNMRSGVNTPTPHAIMLTDDGSVSVTAAKIYVNNFTTAVASIATAWASVDRLNLMSGSVGFGNLAGKLAEVVVYQGVLAGTDLANFRTYLNATRAYGIAVT